MPDAVDTIDWLAGSIAFERSLLIAAAEWITRAPSLPMKMELCRSVWRAAVRVRSQARVLPPVEQRRALECRLDDDGEHLMTTFVTAPSADAFMIAWRTLVVPAAAHAYAEVAERATGAVRLATRRAVRFYRRVAAAGRRTPRRRSLPSADVNYLRRVERMTTCLATLRCVERIGGDPCREARAVVTVPERERTIRALRTGEAHLDTWMVSSDPDVQRYLHQMIGFEITAFEVASRQIADFPEMPWEFHRDLAIQVRDELAHLEMWLDRLPYCHGRLGQFPLSSLEFDFCMSSNLPARLALLQRLLEGFALEALDVNRLLWEGRGDRVMVAYVARVQADEIMHVRRGNKWLRWLCGTQPVLEATVDAAELASRERLLEAARALEESGTVDPENVELVRLTLDQARAFPVDPELRRRAGFSEREIRQEQDRRYVSTHGR
jgi:uncharacterized ferritin-like protein (DUF455 family)